MSAGFALAMTVTMLLAAPSSRAGEHGPGGPHRYRATPGLEVAQVQTRGPLPGAWARARLRALRSELLGCYRRHGWPAPKRRTGNIALVLKVSRAGHTHVRSVGMGTLRSQATNRCVATRLRKLRFPGRDRSTTVTVGLRFYGRLRGLMLDWKITVSGGVRSQRLFRVVKAHYAAYRRCFLEYSDLRNPEGTLRVLLRATPLRYEVERMSGTVRTPGLRQCVVHVTKRLQRFVPSPSGHATITFTFHRPPSRKERGRSSKAR